jgi:lipoprotein-anchoring transpeptidase ErfK/SrfK
MKTGLLVLGAVTVLVGLGVVGGAYAFDHAKRDRIAPGVTVNGVQIGGLSRQAAGAKLRAALLAPLSKPVVATYHGHAFTLTPRAAGVKLDIAGTVEQALARSRQGNLFSRSWRELRSAQLAAALTANVAYDKDAVAAVVSRARARINRAARDAHVDLEHGIVDPKPSRTGVRVKYTTLSRDLTKALLTAGGAKSVAIHTAPVKPKVSTASLARKYPTVILVDRNRFTLRLFKGLKLKKTYGVAVGQIGLETPAGLYHVQNKAVDPAWHVPNSPWAGSLAGQVIPAGDPGNPIKARWMGIFDGAGIHGTSEDGSIGSAASHGCIRMHIPDAEWLFNHVTIGTTVFIVSQ